MNELRQLEDQVLEFIDGRGTFDATLERVIDYQRRWNAPLAKYWAKRNFDGSVPREIPGVPTDVFRHVALVSSEAPVDRTFRTSGTTSGQRGQSHRLSTRLYDHSALVHARATLLPAPPYPFLNAVLDPKTHPDSSLSHMVELFNRELSTAPQPYFLAETGLDVAGLDTAIQQCSAPVVLFGTAFALAHFVEESPSSPLPDGSIVIETGGFKGKHRELARDELYRILAEQFALPMSSIRSEYSMTELSSQLYSLPWTGDGPQLLVPPHWCRVDTVDPISLRPLAAGERGLLRFVDLANVDTVVAIQTSDLGEITDEGHVILHGRAPGSTPRGCSLAAEEILALTEAKSST